MGVLRKKALSQVLTYVVCLYLSDTELNWTEIEETYIKEWEGAI